MASPSVDLCSFLVVTQHCFVCSNSTTVVSWISTHYVFLITFRRERLSCIFKTMLATRFRTGSGSLITSAFDRPEHQSFRVIQTSRNLTRSASPVALLLGFEPPRTALAIGAHSDAKFQSIPSRFDRPFMRMVDRPAKTRSCGNDFNSLTGEFGLSSPES
jgi:hypothetical protein